MYVHAKSSYPIHVKKFNSYGQAIKMMRMCTKEEANQENKTMVERHQRQSGYNSKCIDREFNKVDNLNIY